VIVMPTGAVAWAGEQIGDGHLLPPGRDERIQRGLGQRHPLLLPRQQLIEPPPVGMRHAFEEARRRNVPVLLSVGYAACHWCHWCHGVAVALMSRLWWPVPA
jgi:Protein of unknown function, DUF255